MVSVADEIFPASGHPAYVQTEWSKGWAYAVIGFGGAARMLTEQRGEMHASVDQVGLAVFFLQRHRVELVIKQALVDLGEDPVAVAKFKHDIANLWRKLGEVVRTENPNHWEQISSEHSDFVAAIDEADRGSFSYRYPIDMAGGEPERAPFIDLDASSAMRTPLRTASRGTPTIAPSSRQNASTGMSLSQKLDADSWEFTRSPPESRLQPRLVASRFASYG